MRSPFRYPGGKSGVASRIVNLLIQPPHLSRYVEPFVGGGAVALRVAQDHPGLSLYLNDADDRVAALWLVLSDRDDAAYEKLVRRLVSTVPSVDLWRTEKAARFAGSYDDLAFRALFLNRCTFSGNMSLGSGGPIGGYDQTGTWKIDARWKLPLLLPNLEKVRTLLTARRVVVTAGGWEEVATIAGYQYYDPPYITKHARALYSSFFTTDQHLALRAHLRHNRYPWVLSYDQDPDGFVAWLYEFAHREDVAHRTRIQQAGPEARQEVLYWLRPPTRKLPRSYGATPVPSGSSRADRGPRQPAAGDDDGLGQDGDGDQRGAPAATAASGRPRRRVRLEVDQVAVGEGDQQVGSPSKRAGGRRNQAAT